MSQSVIIRQPQYDKLCDKVMYLGYNTVLRMNVLLSRANKDGTRNHYHHEYKYSSSKYIDTNELMTLRRDFDYFLSIENIRNENGYRETINIRIQDMMYVRDQINQAGQWFRMDLFGKKNNKLVMLGKVEPIFITKLQFDKYLKLEPIIIKYEDGNECTGVRMSLSSDNDFVDINLDTFMAFTYTINTIDLFASAQRMLNYLQRPEYGYNLYTFSNSNKFEAQYPDEGYISAPKRQIQPQTKQNTFFNKMDNL